MKRVDEMVGVVHGYLAFENGKGISIRALRQQLTEGEGQKKKGCTKGSFIEALDTAIKGHRLAWSVTSRTVHGKMV